MKALKLYLAARYARKDEIARHAAMFEAHGFIVTSTWHTEPHAPDVPLTMIPESVLRENARRDLSELYNSDVLLFYAEDGAPSTGGRHVEFGYAQMLGMPIIVNGCKENVFHYMSHIRHVQTVEAALALLLEAANEQL